MSILIGVISGIATLVILLLIIALFLKKEYAIQREVVINKPVPQVFDYIKYVKNQDNYSVWNQIDPAMKKTYTGTDGTPGFMYEWDSKHKKAGKGEQKITGIDEGKKINMNIHFIKPFDGLANAYMATAPAAAGQTTVTWGIDSKMNYPMNIMLLFMNMDKLMGKDLADGLTNLKGILEK